MSSTAATITTSSAKGIWRLNEVMQSLFAAIWPLSTSPTIEYLVVAGGGAGGGATSSGAVKVAAALVVIVLQLVFLL